MCGIIGITSSKPVSSAIINSLRKLIKGNKELVFRMINEGIEYVE